MKALVDLSRCFAALGGNLKHAPAKMELLPVASRRPHQINFAVSHQLDVLTQNHFGVY